jgi:prolyl-tRNA editing enzyme YbaK/EbsC (Cys-tRNA(Pro) deacylase)
LGRVSDYLSKSGAKYELREFDGSTKNSALAAHALGCGVAEIAKSVVFVGEKTAVVIISGDRRVDGAKLARIVGAELRAARADEVRDRTGFPIGGVPPFPHGEGIVVLADASLTRFGRVWAAAGTPNSVFGIGTQDLFRLLGSKPVDVAEQTQEL